MENLKLKTIHSKSQYYIVVDGEIYTRHKTSHSTRTVWDRACDVALSYCYQNGTNEYHKLKDSGRLKIMKVNITSVPRWVLCTQYD